MENIPDYRLAYTNGNINDLLKSETQNKESYTRHFSQDEDFFIRLEEPVRVPSFDIHHSVHQRKPSDAYVSSFKEFISALTQRLPEIFHGLIWFFDPRSILKPSFFHLMRRGERYYLYVLSIDLVMRPTGCRELVPGTNNKTAEYETNRIFMDSFLLPLKGPIEEGTQERHVHVEKIFNDTFIGESGRGYFVQGTWIDPDLNKFLSRLMVPKAKRVYPYFPFRCIHNTLATAVLGLNHQARRRATKVQDLVYEFLIPHSEGIQKHLKKHEYDAKDEYFQKIQGLVPQDILGLMSRFDIKVYLNEENHKEFSFHGQEDGF